jgi:PAS domain S-box-containing protein
VSLEKSNISKDDRLEKITQLLLQYTLGNYGHRETVSPKGDEIDAVIIGLNTLGEELQAASKKGGLPKDPRLEKILDLLLKYTLADYSHREFISGKGDEIDAIIIGLNTLGEELQGAGIVVRDYKERMEAITEVLLKYTLGDLSEKVKVSGVGDELDAITIGLNTMAEELESSIKAQEDQLKRIEATNNFLDAILENIPNMVFVKEAKELRFVRFNKAGEDLLGYSRAELIGKNDRDFFPKEQADFFIAKDREALGSNSITDIPEEAVETKWGTKWLHTRKIPIKDVEGKVAYLLGISEDITQARETAQALKRSEENLRLLIQGARDYAIFMVDPDGNIITWNKGAELVKGYTSEEAIGKNISMFYTDEDKKNGRPEHNLAEAKRLGSYEDEGWRVKKDGTKFWADVLFTPIYDELQQLKGYSKITRDVTEKRMAEEQIKSLNKKLESNVKQLEVVNNELEAFTYSVSHDLRAPLRAIHGYTKILEEEFAGKIDEDSKRMMTGVMNNAKKMGQLIDDLLALSRLGKKELVKKETDLTGLMNQSLNELKKSVDTSKASITIDTLGSALVDPSLMQQVFINLLSNAVKYSSLKEKPVIKVGMKKQGDETIYYIKDNGTGFDMQYYNKLFGVFQRLHDSYEFEGTGVGLALVKRILVRHGGKIWAEAAVDKGATFYFTLK